ncbi:ArpU family phage packaging/lysis transcriptional regulator [Companilactobacillus mishanensis]|uniref:ArpU family transcriptional regulator n=1 Tax=Companilactobacillus mishanensis TaxID=2486008 RepID=A0A5P0ZF46_9LACO|nr:ArpU family phage packaging/lysis transcriptional regulator [Companilactobacillus mishanensis]MQS44259.1 hypothetical protein [Companilactobacillus mishanensis]MQS51638.1 hypothetical protein [Companilactobacillus mishanensis]
MGLLPVIDEVETQGEVRSYFEQEFPRLVLQAGYSMLDIQSPSFTGMPKGSFVNNTEESMMRHLEAIDLVQATIESITKCPETEKNILMFAYVYKMRDRNIQIRLGYQHSRYNLLKNQALLAFADAFQKYHDFHVYED